MILRGDCLDVMPTMAAGSVDAIVTDPPYGLAMGKDWDHGVPGVHFWQEALRVAKPGASLVAFGGTRTHHRLMVAIEDAGWEIRDTLMWLYGSGFPKSLNGPWGGTALKPAWEPIILARTPLAGTVAQNVLTHGVGGLNIAGCRIGSGADKIGGGCAGVTALHDGGITKRTPVDYTTGRWPANLLLDEDSAALLGEPARFFYCSKASTRERNHGLAEGHRNDHPTVKPLDLMRWLVRLVTPPGGLVLDPFAGSGTTGLACAAEGCQFTGIEVTDSYATMAEQRLGVPAPAVADLSCEDILDTLLEVG